MNKVVVLMSVYNGERYLAEQLDSILKQDYPNIDILIRDDGANEATKDILRKYQRENDNIYVFSGDNLGVPFSYFELLRLIDIDRWDFFAFSDQDDVWLPQKISSAIIQLEQYEAENPILYCSNLVIVDESLNEKGTVFGQQKICPSFGNALIENICVGCTLVANQRLVQMIKHNIPKYCIMHDWWFYLVASAFGKVIYDSKAQILYRQHEKNVVGARYSILCLWRSRIKNAGVQRGKRYSQVAEFFYVFKERLDHEEVVEAVVKSFLNYRKNWKACIRLLSDGNVVRQKRIDNLIFNLLFLIKYI